MEVVHGIVKEVAVATIAVEVVVAEAGTTITLAEVINRATAVVLLEITLVRVVDQLLTVLILLCHSLVQRICFIK